MERTRIPITGLIRQRIGLVSGLDFANMDFVRGLVRSIPCDRYTLVLTSGAAPCTIAMAEAEKVQLPCVTKLWKCKPHRLIPFCGSFLMLYDGGTCEPMANLMAYAAKWAPQTTFRIYDSLGPIENSVASLYSKCGTVRPVRRLHGADEGGSTSGIK